MQSTEWASVQPAAGEKQWTDVRDTWKGADAADTVMALFADSFGWSVDTAGHSYANRLRNQLPTATADVLVWNDFESTYMAAPLVGVSS